MFENKNIKTIPGVSDSEINKLEQITKGELPEDYKMYLRNYGLVSLEGRDIFGLGNDKYFNTLKITKELQDQFNLDKSYVLIEDVGTESMYIVLKTTNGFIYEWTPNGHLKEIYKSFSDFIQNDF
jgi:hypothetical protein